MIFGAVNHHNWDLGLADFFLATPDFIIYVIILFMNPGEPHYLTTASASLLVTSSILFKSFEWFNCSIPFTST